MHSTCKINVITLLQPWQLMCYCTNQCNQWSADVSFKTESRNVSFITSKEILPKKSLHLIGNRLCKSGVWSDPDVNNMCRLNSVWSSDLFLIQKHLFCLRAATKLLSALLRSFAVLLCADTLEKICLDMCAHPGCRVKVTPNNYARHLLQRDSLGKVCNWWD